MAVYTQVSAEEIATLLARYGAAPLVSAKGIAEGVENSNYLVDTEDHRYILTLYEKRVDKADLPFCLALIDHLADRGLPVPRALRDHDGTQIQHVAGRPACLIEFLPGVSLSHPVVAQARAAARMMGEMHRALADFPLERPNSLGVDAWAPLLGRCGHDLDAIRPGLYDRISVALEDVLPRWDRTASRSVIHADLFPDNVLTLGDRVTGIIDFYFACSDVRLYDLAVMHGSWCFDTNGERYDAAISGALLDGYAAGFGLSDADRAALPVLAMGGCIRFALTRAWDWLNTPADALVTRKDPLAYVRRLDFYAQQGAALFR